MTPLAQMGARIEARENRFPPLTIHGGKLHPHRVHAAGGERAGEELRAAGRACTPKAAPRFMSRCARAITPSWRCANSAPTWKSERLSITVTGRPHLQGSRAARAGRSFVGRVFSGGRADRSRVQPHHSRRGTESHPFRAARFSGRNGRADQDSGCQLHRGRTDRRCADPQIAHSRRSARKSANRRADRRDSGAGRVGRGQRGRADRARRVRIARQGDRSHRHHRRKLPAHGS